MNNNIKILFMFLLIILKEIICLSIALVGSYSFGSIVCEFLPHAPTSGVEKTVGFILTGFMALVFLTIIFYALYLLILIGWSAATEKTYEYEKSKQYKKLLKKNNHE